jgi:hypothetical protein
MTIRINVTNDDEAGPARIETFNECGVRQGSFLLRPGEERAVYVHTSQSFIVSEVGGAKVGPHDITGSMA